MNATAATAWAPDRYQIRNNPEPGIASASYDSLNPDQPPICIVRPDPENLERSLLTNHQDQTKSMVHYEACRQQQSFLSSLNERFYSVEDEASGRGYLHIHDRLREAVDPNRHRLLSCIQL